MSAAMPSITGIVRSERKMPPIPSVSPIVCRRPWRLGISKSISVASCPPTWIMLITWSQPSSAARRSRWASIVAWAPSAWFVQRAIASPVASRSGSMSCRAIVASASSGKLRMSPSRSRVNSTLPAPTKAMRVMRESVSGLIETSKNVHNRRAARTRPAVHRALPHVTDAGALPAHTGLLVSLERSGSRRTPEGLRSAELLPGVGADGVRRLGGTGAKLLLRLRADREDADGENAAVLREAVADCAAHHLLLVVEVLVYRLDDEDEAGYEAARGDLIREAALLAESCGARYLKLEYPGDEQACLRVTDALSVPWALLSAGVDHETFMVQLRSALAAGAAGFITGRSIWKESVAMRGEERRAFLGGKARRRLDQLLAIAG